MSTRIEITADDISCGAVRESRSCPAALAINRTLGPGLFARVFRAGVVIYRQDGDDGDCIEESSLFGTWLPIPVREWVKAFDSYIIGKRYVEPIVFELDLPKEVLA